MFKSDYIKESFSSARSGRVSKVFLAPPFLIFGIYGASIIIQIPAGYVIHHFSFALGMLLNQIVGLLAPVIIVIRAFGLTASAILPFKRVRPLHVVVAAIMIISLSLVTDYLIFLTEYFLPVGKKLNESYTVLLKVDGLFGFLIKFSFICFLPSICEEIFFRGFCQTGLMRYYGTRIGIVITALLFAVAHLTPWYTHLFFLLGLFLSWIFATSGNLWMPVICHIVNNVWTFIMYKVGLGMPLKGPSIWWNIPILVFSLAILLLSVYAWHRLHRVSKVHNGLR